MEGLVEKVSRPFLICIRPNAFSSSQTPTPPSSSSLPLGKMISSLRKMACLTFHIFKDSVYALYPFFTPEHMKETLTKRKLAKKYTFDPPVTVHVPKVLNSFAGIKTAFGDSNRFKVIYEVQIWPDPGVRRDCQVSPASLCQQRADSLQMR